MNRVQKRKFTLALNGLLRARKDCLEWSDHLNNWPDHKQRLWDKSETKRLYLYRVVDELVQEGVHEGFNYCGLATHSTLQPLQNPDVKASLADHQP